MPKNIWAATGIKVAASAEDYAGETDLVPDNGGFVTIPEDSEVSGRFDKKTLEQYLEQGVVTTTEPPAPEAVVEDAVAAAARREDVTDSPFQKLTKAQLDELVEDDEESDYPNSGTKDDKIAWLIDNDVDFPEGSEDD